MRAVSAKAVGLLTSSSHELAVGHVLQIFGKLEAIPLINISSNEVRVEVQGLEGGE